MGVTFMAIQTIDLTTPGGDTPRTANTKVNANFVYLDAKVNTNYAALDAKVVPVANTLGTSTTTAVSQDLLTKQVGDIGAVLDAVNGVIV